MTPIISFTGKYAFLSNFWLCLVKLDGESYLSVEHAYQAAKTLDPEERTKISMTIAPAKVKKLGRMITLRSDWDEVKIEVMLDLVRQKFKDPTLQRYLLATGDATLVEGNWWGDIFWGVYRGEGRNHLGKILMQVRSEVR